VSGPGAADSHEGIPANSTGGMGGHACVGGHASCRGRAALDRQRFRTDKAMEPLAQRPVVAPTSPFSTASTSASRLNFTPTERRRQRAGLAREDLLTGMQLGAEPSWTGGGGLWPHGLPYNGHQRRRAIFSLAEFQAGGSRRHACRP